jgi:hypothetical protein
MAKTIKEVLAQLENLGYNESDALTFLCRACFATGAGFAINGLTPPYAYNDERHMAMVEVLDDWVVPVQKQAMEFGMQDAVDQVTEWQALEAKLDEEQKRLNALGV